MGKIERFWGTLWRELLQGAIFRGIEDARRRIGLFIDHYNFLRPHQGIDNLVPADRFFAAAKEVKETLKARIDGRSLELATHGEPRKPFYLTGRVGDTSLSLHAQGERVVMTREDGRREEVDLAAPGRRQDEREAPRAGVSRDASPPDPEAYAHDSAERAPGTSPLDEGLERLVEEWEEEPGGVEPSPSPDGEGDESPAESKRSSSAELDAPDAEEGR